MHCLEVIIERNREASESAISKRIVRETLLLVANSSDYLKMRVAEAIRHLENLK